MDSTAENLRLASRRILERASVRPGETVAITSDVGTDPQIATSIVNEATELGARAVALTVPAVLQKDDHVEEPPSMFTEALKRADLIIPVVHYPSSYSEAYRQILPRTRVLGFAYPPTASEAIRWMLEVDYEKSDRLTTAVTDLLRTTHEFRITSPAGTDVTMTFGGRHVADDPGRVGNVGDENFLPGACVCVAPLEESWNGSIVFDALFYPPIGLLESPLRFVTVAGAIKEIEGAEAKRLIEWLDSFEDSNMYRMCHIGIGLNAEFQTFTGVKDLDERIRGLVGTGIGSNDIPVFEGTIRAKSHADGYMKGASVFLDGVALLEGGVFVHERLNGL